MVNTNISKSEKIVANTRVEKIVELFEPPWMICQADLDVEDLIALGYSCSLTDSNVQNFRPGVEIVCDDGICSECIKFGEPGLGRQLGFFKSTTHLDVEDLIALGYACSSADCPDVQNFRPDVEFVCDDGICSQCIKIGEPVDGRNLGFYQSTTDLDVDDLIALGFTCSLADTNVQNFRPGVEVVCDDGICSQCIKNPRLRLGKI